MAAVREAWEKPVLTDLTLWGTPEVFTPQSSPELDPTSLEIGCSGNGPLLPVDIYTGAEIPMEDVERAKRNRWDAALSHVIDNGSGDLVQDSLPSILNTLK